MRERPPIKLINDIYINIYMMYTRVSHTVQLIRCNANLSTPSHIQTNLFITHTLFSLISYLLCITEVEDSDSDSSFNFVLIITILFAVFVFDLA